jgi:hypothetical protein
MWGEVSTLQRLSVGVCSTPGGNKVGKGQTHICTRLSTVKENNAAK